MENIEYSEGDKCKSCEKGFLIYPKVENCSCHINPPCSSCVDNKLTCDNCGWEEPEIKNEETYQHVGGGIIASFFTRPSHDFGNGKRIFDYDYDSSSGSTMVFKGRYKGDVTEKDILDYFGDGTFGHLGPYLNNGIFTYTKITD